MATALGSLALPIGCIIGFAIPPIMISDDDLSDNYNARKKMTYYIFFQNCLATVMTLPMLIFAQEKPKTPPSAAAGMKEEPLKLR